MSDAIQLANGAANGTNCRDASTPAQGRARDEGAISPAERVAARAQHHEHLLAQQPRLHGGLGSPAASRKRGQGKTAGGRRQRARHLPCATLIGSLIPLLRRLDEVRRIAWPCHLRNILVLFEGTLRSEVEHLCEVVTVRLVMRLQTQCCTLVPQRLPSACAPQAMQQCEQHSRTSACVVGMGSLENGAGHTQT